MSTPWTSAYVLTFPLGIVGSTEWGEITAVVVWFTRLQNWDWSSKLGVREKPFLSPPAEKDADNCPGLCPLQVTWDLEAETRMLLCAGFPRLGWRPVEHWGPHCWRQIRLITQQRLREGAGRLGLVEWRKQSV